MRESCSEKVENLVVLRAQKFRKADYDSMDAVCLYMG